MDKLHRVEDLILGLILVALFGTGLLQIVLRNFFDTGLLWSESLSRVLLLWGALVGAMVASRNNRHIQISLLDKLLPAAWQVRLRRFIHALSAFVCWLVAYVSLTFVREEYTFNEIAFGAVKLWMTESIIPLAFGVIGLRMALCTFVPGPQPDQQGELHR